MAVEAIMGKTAGARIFFLWRCRQQGLLDPRVSHIANSVAYFQTLKQRQIATGYNFENESACGILPSARAQCASNSFSGLGTFF